MSSWLWLHIDFIFVCLSHKPHGCSKWDVNPGMGAILLPEARHHHSSSFVHPSALTPRLLSVMRATARPGDKPASPTSSLPFLTIHCCLQRTWTPWFIFPPAFSPSSLPLGPRLAPGRPVYVPLRRLLITTWMQAGKGLLRLGRQQKATDLQFTTAAHPPIPCILGLELSPVWLRMERGTDVHSHAHVMPVHAFICMCVQSMYVCASRKMMLHLVIIRIYEKRSHSGMNGHFKRKFKQRLKTKRINTWKTDFFKREFKTCKASRKHPAASLLLSLFNENICFNVVFKLAIWKQKLQNASLPSAVILLPPCAGNMAAPVAVHLEFGWVNLEL